MTIKGVFQKIKSNNTVRNMALSGVCKPIAMIVSLIYVRVVLSFLGLEKYGVWSTLLTILSWVSYFDIGIGNGLRNKLTEAINSGKADESKKLVSSAYAFIAVIMLILMAAVAIVAQFIDWNTIFGVSESFEETLSVIVSLSIVFVGSNFILSICRNILYAIQKASVVSFLELATQVLNLVLILIVRVFLSGNVLVVAVIYGGSMILVNVICSIVLYIRNKNFLPSIRKVDLSVGKKLTSLGLKFFVIQVCALVLYSTDSLMISYLYGAAEVTPYATVNKVFTAISSMYVAVIVPIWSAFTKANTEKNYGAMKKSIGKLQLFMIPFLVVAIILTIFFGPVTKIWLGQELNYSAGLILLGLLYCALSIWTNTYAYIGNGLELMKVSMIVAILQAVLNIPLSLLFAKFFNLQSAGVLAGTVSVMIIAAVVMPVYIHRWISQKKKMEIKKEQDIKSQEAKGSEILTYSNRTEDMDKINIYYDYQIMLAQKYGGISRYFYELYTHINDTADAHADAFCLWNKNVYFQKVFNKITDIKMRGLGFFNRIAASKRMKNYDIIHPTYYNPYVLKHKGNKLVITVYDMIHEIYPQMFSSADKTSEYKKKLLYGADHIIAISESTKKDILRIYPDIPSDKITVIYLAGNLEKDFENVNISLPEKYILFVGNRGAYKNFNAFMKSVKPILEADAELNLVCFGGGAFNEQEKALMGDVCNQVIQLNAYDSELAYAYSKALCFVFPSLYEGFGIPTLEAFGCGCPVVLSNTSSMPEVGGDAAVYFDPSDEKDMTCKIRQVIYDESLRGKMIENGQIQFSKFRWDKITEETIECYKKVLGRGEHQ